MPLIVSPYALIVLAHALILGIACTGVNLLLGYGGLLSLGHAAFFGIGAYTGGFLYVFAGVTSFEAYLLSGVCASALLAALLGVLCVRVTRIYFTVLTLAFAQMVHSLFIAGIVFRLAGDFGKGLFFVAEGGLYLPRFTMAGVELEPGAFVIALHPEYVFWCTADPGWVTGTSYGIIAPLTNGITSIVDEGAALEVLKAWGRLSSLGRPRPNGTGDTPGVPGQIPRNH